MKYWNASEKLVCQEGGGVSGGGERFLLSGGATVALGTDPGCRGGVAGDCIVFTGNTKQSGWQGIGDVEVKISGFG